MPASACHVLHTLESQSNYCETDRCHFNHVPLFDNTHVNFEGISRMLTEFSNDTE